MEEKWWKLWSMILPSVLWRCWLGGRKGIRPVKTKRWGTGVVICLEWCADLHMAQLMPLTLTVSCFSKIHIGFTFLVPAHSGSPGKRPLNGGVCALVYDCPVREKPIIYSHHTTVCVSTSPSCRAWFPNTQRINRHIDKTQTYDAIQEPTFQQRTTRFLPSQIKKGKGRPYSIDECRVPELIQVLGSQPADNMSHKPGGRLPLPSARPAVTPATLKRAATNFAAWWTEAQWVWTVCLRLLSDSVATVIWTQVLLRLSPACNFQRRRRLVLAILQCKLWLSTICYSPVYVCLSVRHKSVLYLNNWT